MDKNWKLDKSWFGQKLKNWTKIGNLRKICEFLGKFVNFYRVFIGQICPILETLFQIRIQFFVHLVKFKNKFLKKFKVQLENSRFWRFVLIFGSTLSYVISWFVDNFLKLRKNAGNVNKVKNQRKTGKTGIFKKVNSDNLDNLQFFNFFAFFGFFFLYFWIR